MHLLTLAKNVIDSIQLEHNERRFRNPLYETSAMT
jgi:hypothetical protein